MHIIHHKACEPVLVNGKWELMEYEFDEEYPDEKVRDCDMCTVCGFNGYPECKEDCYSWRPGSRRP
ncbi:MAG: hypothetical protein NC120_12360 [Ruminococcus sp.]|nr:hypothetical protein [Ruminococcus sp.]